MQKLIEKLSEVEMSQMMNTGGEMSLMNFSAKDRSGEFWTPEVQLWTPINCNHFNRLNFKVITFEKKTDFQCYL